MKRMVGEKEREERELAWVPCALVSGYTPSRRKVRREGIRASSG